MRSDVMSLGIYTAVAVAGLGAAYWASLPVDEADAEKVTVIAFEPKEVESVRFEQRQGADGAAPALTVAATRQGDKIWIDYKKEAVSPPPPAVVKEGETPPPPTSPAEPAVEEHFLANKQMDDLLASLNPLRAERDLGKVEDAQLEEFGLKAPTETFTVAGDGKTLTLALGKKSYGSRNRFARDEKSGRIYLIDDTNIENLQRANLRLYQRELTDVELDDVTHAVLQAGTQSKRLAHTTRGKDGELQWTDDAEGATAKPSYASFIDKLSKLRLVSYASEADAAGLAGIEPFFKITLEANGKAVTTMSFLKKPGEAAEYWVMSDRLGTYAKLAPARAEPIEKDVGTIMQ